MEMSFSELRTKEVVNVADGRKLGKVCDMVFCYPENRILGFVVPGQRGFASKRTDFFIELKNIVKIGDDVILVNVGVARAPTGKRHGAQSCQKPCEPTLRGENYNENNAHYQVRRSYEEYE
jgi:YlmC/YmxH family sporulation protein